MLWFYEYLPEKLRERGLKDVQRHCYVLNVGDVKMGKFDKEQRRWKLTRWVEQDKGIKEVFENGCKKYTNQKA